MVIRMRKDFWTLEELDELENFQLHESHESNV